MKRSEKTDFQVATHVQGEFALHTLYLKMQDLVN